MMRGSCCSHEYHNRNKVIPGQTDQVEVKKYGRVNGWTCPPHPFQIIGWLFLIIFGISHFAILVFYLPLDWIPAGIIVPAGGFVIHLTYHILALTLDPADPAVRKKGIFEKGKFDRSKQNHVIENCFCYICQTKVSSKSKHCSMCNKCIFDFDHHCKWLNNCVGGRNYKLFLGCCISAFVTALIMFTIDLYLLCIYYTDRQSVLKRSGLKDWRLFIPVCKEAYIIFDIVNGLLLLIAIVLLAHLLVFHGYLICNKMSTYDYIIQARQKESPKAEQADIESHGEPALPPKALNPLSSAHAGLNGDIHEQRSYEMHSMNVYAGPNDEGIDVVSNPHSLHSYSYSAQDLPNVAAQGRDRPPSTYTIRSSSPGLLNGETFERRKKRKCTKRASSQKQLLDHEYVDDSDAESIQSLRSHNIDVNTSDDEKDEMLVEDLTTSVVITSNRISQAVSLQEEKIGEDELENSRNESIVSRPKSPLPRESIQDYYLSQSDSSNPVLTPVGLTEPINEGSVKSNNSSVATLQSMRNVGIISNDTEDSGIGKNDEMSSPLYTVRPLSEIQHNQYLMNSADSPLSLTDALNDGSLQQTNVAVETTDDIVNSLEIADSEKRLNDPDDNYSDKNVSHSSDSGSGTLTDMKPSEITNSEENPSYSDTGVDCTRVEEPENLTFEDDFILANEQIQEKLQQCAECDSGHSNHESELNLASDIQPEDENDGIPASDIEPKDENDGIPASDDYDDETKEKLRRYIEAFKRKESTFSFGSDSDFSASEVPLSKVKEDVDPSTLQESLGRMKKLSDAFPLADEQENFNRSPLTRPPFMSFDSMAELSVVEYSRKKRLRKLDGNYGEVKSELPPIRGARFISPTKSNA